MAAQKGVKDLINGQCAMLLWSRFIERLIHISSIDWGASDTSRMSFFRKKKFVPRSVICHGSLFRLAPASFLRVVG